METKSREIKSIIGKFVNELKGILDVEKYNLHVNIFPTENQSDYPVGYINSNKIKSWNIESDKEGFKFFKTVDGHKYHYTGKLVDTVR